MSKATGERFVQLIWDALRHPDSNDHRSALLVAASAFLDAIGTDSGFEADAGRRIGHLAMDHAAFGGDTTELRYAASVLAMHGKLETLGERIANLEQ